MSDIVILDTTHDDSPLLEDLRLRMQHADIRPFDVTQDLNRLEARFPFIFKLFETVGIHPLRESEIINPYSKEVATEKFTNVGEHCIAVAFAAGRIAYSMYQLGRISDSDVDYVVTRALLHDLSKPYEIMRKKSLADLGSDEAYLPSAYEQLAPLLENLGFNHDTVSYIAKAGKETGHNSLKDFIVCDSTQSISLTPGKIADKIIHLADDITFTSTPSEGKEAKTLFLSPMKRMMASRFHAKYPWMRTSGLGVNSKNEIVAVRDLNDIEKGVSKIGSYMELQVKVATMISGELQSYIDPVSTLEPNTFINQLVNAQ